ncbi:LysR family transcriptional regulator [Bradyrhizobium tropiciagri]|uniref:LysR family transcriptional regulator n=1 Tax=Bradyrhizobium tropiciagri TaxID=312253 RepID=UPI00067DD395|nr:LysR family transcriptional regulator [Bradyrhizobium tropiciagri]
MLHARILTYLDEVARLGSIRKAAARLNVASSAINRQILALETELGTPIFERMPRRLRLTSAGEILIMHVRETLKSSQRVAAQIEALKGLQRGEATIATMNGLAGGPLPRFLAGVMGAHPRMHIRLRVLTLDQIPNAVLTGEADIALGYNFPAGPGLRVVASHDLHLGAVVAPGHPLTRRKPAWLADCLEFPLVLGDASMTIRPVVELAFTRAGIPLHPTIESNSIAFMMRIVREGNAVTFLNPVDIGVDIARGDLVFIPFQDLRVDPITIKLAVRARGTLDAFPSVLLEEMRIAMPGLQRT